MSNENKDRFIGTARENDQRIGRAGEISYDLDNFQARLHDGKTKGGRSRVVIEDRTVVNEDVVTVNRFFSGANGTQLAKAMDATQTYIVVHHNDLTSGDRIVLESGGSREWLAVTSGATAEDIYYRYTVTRDLASTGALAFRVGTSVANTGQTGDIFVDVYGNTSLAGDDGPGIAVYKRLSATYNDVAPLFKSGQMDGTYGRTASAFGTAVGAVQSTGNTPWMTWDETQKAFVFEIATGVYVKVGDLDGSYGYTGSTFGVAIGLYNTDVWMTFDATDGFRFHESGGILAQVNPSGVVMVGREAASQVNLRRNASGEIEISVNATAVAKVTTAGVIEFGASNAFHIDGLNDLLAFFGQTKIAQPASADQAALGTQTQVDIGTLTITNPADTPADADALRDDLVANTIPDILTAIETVRDEVNAAKSDVSDIRTLLISIRTALVNLGIIKGAA